MGLPDVSLTIRDGALGIVPPNSNNIALKAGACMLGTLNTLISVTDLPSLRSAIGNTGPVAEAAAVSLSQAGGPLYVVPVNPSTYGAPGTVVKVGTGAETLTVTAKPPVQVLLKFTTAGAAGSAQFQLSFDGGNTFGPTQTSAATLILGGYSFLTLAFGAGAAVIGDTFTYGTDGTVTPGGGNTGTLSPTISSASVADAYQLVVSLTLGGALGTAQFTYSLDGGNTTQGPFLIPASGKYVIPDTGLLLTFAGTSTAGDLFTCACTAPTFSGSDLTTAFNAIILLPQTWFLFHVVGPAASAAAAATLAGTLDGLLATAATGFRFARGMVECPWDTVTNTDSVCSSAFAAVASTGGRTMVGGGTYVQNSPLKGHQLTRNSAWIVTARAAAVGPSTDCAQVNLGPIPGIVKLNRDENATPALDAARFCTLRTIIGKQGFYVTNARSLATVGSDYTFLVNGRVMDIFCPTFRTAALNFLNSPVRVDASSGFILESDAGSIEGYIDGQCRAALTQPGYATGITITVNRNTNILSSGQLQITGRVVPFGYARSISGDLGFTNPALAQK